MSKVAGAFDPTSAQSGTMVTGLLGSGYLGIHNLSPCDVQFSDSYGNSWMSFANSARLIHICNTTPTLDWAVEQNVYGSANPTKIIYIEAYNQDEQIGGDYPISYARATGIQGTVATNPSGPVPIYNADGTVMSIVPQGGAMPVSGGVNVNNTPQIQVTADQLLFTSPSNMILGSVNSYYVTLPANSHSITVVTNGFNNWTDLAVIGNTTRSYYYNLPTIKSVTSYPTTFVVPASIDTQLQLNLTPTYAAAKVWIISHLDYTEPPISNFGMVPIIESLRNAQASNAWYSASVAAATGWTNVYSIYCTPSQRVHLSNIFFHSGPVVGANFLLEFDNNSLSTIYARFAQLTSASTDQYLHLPGPIDFLPAQNGYLSMWVRNSGSTAVQMDGSFNGWLITI